MHLDEFTKRVRFSSLFLICIGGIMAYSKTEQAAFDLAKDIVEQYDCYIYDIEYIKEGANKFLRIYADKDGGISIDECEKISRKLSTLLDEKDLIKENYILEVSSPGIERKLKTKEHFEKYIGKSVDINLFKPLDGQKQITGILKGFDDGLITIEADTGLFTINQKEASYVKLHFDF